MFENHLDLLGIYLRIKKIYLLPVHVVNDMYGIDFLFIRGSGVWKIMRYFVQKKFVRRDCESVSFFKEVYNRLGVL